MDFGPPLQPLIAVFLYLIPLVIVGGIIKTPWFKGKAGEPDGSGQEWKDASEPLWIKGFTFEHEA